MKDGLETQFDNLVIEHREMRKYILDIVQWHQGEGNANSEWMYNEALKIISNIEEIEE